MSQDEESGDHLTGQGVSSLSRDRFIGGVNRDGTNHPHDLHRTVRFDDTAAATVARKRSRNDIPVTEQEDALEDDTLLFPTRPQLLAAKRQRRLQRELDPAALTVLDPQDLDVLDETAFETEYDTNDDDDYLDSEQYRRFNKSADDVPMEPFHMDNDEADGTGYFDGDTYVFRKRGPEDEPDAWLESLGEKNWRQQQQQDDDVVDGMEHTTTQTDLDQMTLPQLYAKILAHLNDSETILQAIARYGNVLKRQKQQKQKQQTPQNNKTTVETDKNDPDWKLSQLALNELTEASSALLLRPGHADIYQQTRNDLLQLLRRGEDDNTTQRDNHETATSTVQWEYQGSQDGAIHGLFSTQQMLDWVRAGYFVGPSAVNVRTVGSKTNNTGITLSTQTPSSAQLQEDLLSDLLEDHDENNDDDDHESSKLSVLQRGEWIRSDQVDFSAYT